MREHEWRIYSQNGEDGVLRHIFNTIGVTNKTAVEFGVGCGSQNNTRLLADDGWTVFWFDVDHNDTCLHNIRFKQMMLTPDNIQHEFIHAGVPDEFDLLSVDVDGNDYHLRQSLHMYSPRVCVMEYNGTRAADEQYVMPRDDNYSWAGVDDHAFGASLLSLTLLSDSLGYDLVHVEHTGANAFFVRRDVNQFETKTVQQLWRPVRWYRDNRTSVK